MTIILQVILLFGLLLTGAAFVFGLLQDNGAMLMVGTYFGWFMAAASVVSYFILMILLLVRGTLPDWGRFSLVNMGFVSIGIALLGIESSFAGAWLVAAIMLGTVLSIPAGLLKAFDTRTSVIVVWALVAITASTPIVKVWVLVAMCLGIIFVGSQLITLARHSRPGPRT